MSDTSHGGSVAQGLAQEGERQWRELNTHERRMNMSRSGYSEDLVSDDPLAYGQWRGRVASAIRGRRGQAFLRDLADAMDAMPEKILIAEELIDESGDCCAIGVVCKARGIDVSQIDCEDSEQVAVAVNIAKPMAAEIEYLNDECGWHTSHGQETPGDRWLRIRNWVELKLQRAT